MCYIKAKDVLPTEVIEIIQKYIEGEYIYIPKKVENRQKWGANTPIRKEMILRNESIFKEYEKGINREVLAEKYFLSKKSIDRIILKEKNKQI
ncbi:MAG: CD3324 family protein [Cellulosilyticaceae bacterium]